MTLSNPLDRRCATCNGTGTTPAEQMRTVPVIAPPWYIEAARKERRAEETAGVRDEVRERITERIEGALRSNVRPWPEDPDGFYYSSADVLARWIIEQIEAA